MEEQQLGPGVPHVRFKSTRIDFGLRCQGYTGSASRRHFLHMTRPELILKYSRSPSGSEESIPSLI